MCSSATVHRKTSPIQQKMRNQMKARELNTCSGKLNGCRTSSSAFVISIFFLEPNLANEDCMMHAASVFLRLHSQDCTDKWPLVSCNSGGKPRFKNVPSVRMSCTSAVLLAIRSVHVSLLHRPPSLSFCGNLSDI